MIPSQCRSLNRSRLEFHTGAHFCLYLFHRYSHSVVTNVYINHCLAKYRKISNQKFFFRNVTYGCNFFDMSGRNTAHRKKIHFEAWDTRPCNFSHRTATGFWGSNVGEFSKWLPFQFQRWFPWINLIVRLSKNIRRELILSKVTHIALWKRSFIRVVYGDSHASTWAWL